MHSPGEIHGNRRNIKPGILLLREQNQSAIGLHCPCAGGLSIDWRNRQSSLCACGGSEVGNDMRIYIIVRCWTIFDYKR